MSVNLSIAWQFYTVISMTNRCFYQSTARLYTRFDQKIQQKYSKSITLYIFLSRRRTSTTSNSQNSIYHHATAKSIIPWKSWLCIIYRSLPDTNSFIIPISLEHTVIISKWVELTALPHVHSLITLNNGAARNHKSAYHITATVE